MADDKSKVVKMRTEKWQEAKDLADTLAAERGSIVYVTDAIAEAVKFFSEHRPKPASKK